MELSELMFSGKTMSFKGFLEYLTQLFGSIWLFKWEDDLELLKK
jgi:hypothetical protein